MRDLISEYQRFASAGAPFGRAVVTSVWGSAPRPEGSSMLASKTGAIAGSVSGGCVESATAGEITEAIARGTPKLVTYGVSHERAWEVGLACGGTIRVFVEPSVRPEVLDAASGSGGEVVATVIEGPQLGRSALVFEDGRVHVAVELVRLAKPLGYRTIVADGRESFLTRERFPTADELILGWPEEAFTRIGLDASCYVCILSHDPKFDEPALKLALRSPAAYVGAIGSRKTQTERRQWLQAE